MNCRSVRAKLSAYVDGELNGYEMLDIRAHLSSCCDCDEEVGNLRRLKNILGSLSDQEPDTEFHSRLNERVFAASSRSRPRRVSVAMISGIAFVTALLVSLATLRSQPTVTHAKLAARSSEQSNFDVSRDQAYQAGGDPFNDASFIITASAPVGGR